MCVLSFLPRSPMSMRTLRFYPENEDNGSAYYKRPNEDWLPLYTGLPRRDIPGNLESGVDLLLRPNPLLNPRPALSAGSPT
jgi:hypothetical protein